MQYQVEGETSINPLSHKRGGVGVYCLRTPVVIAANF